MLDVAYVITLVAGFISNRNLNDPLKDPHLAIAELLILVMAPVMVTIAVAIHTTAFAEYQPYTLMSLAWMSAAAGTTSIVHFVELTVARRVDQATPPGYDRVFGWRWPSVRPIRHRHRRVGHLLCLRSPVRSPSRRRHRGPGRPGSKRRPLACRARGPRNQSPRMASHRDLRLSHWRSGSVAEVDVGEASVEPAGQVPVALAEQGHVATGRASRGRRWRRGGRRWRG